jgi:hypothetical protein
MAWLGRSLIGTGISVTVWQGSWRLLSMDIFVLQGQVRLPLQPIFKRKYASFENSLAAKYVLLKITTQWFDAGTLEYVCRWHCVQQCILACGWVDKATEPFIAW